MVSKLSKRSPKKTPKASPKSLSRRSTRRRKSSSPLKTISAASAAVAASLDRSIRSCRRRIFCAFAHLALLSTPSKLRKQGFHRLRLAQEAPPLITATGRPLPPPAFPEKKTVFLDLDETLIHSQSDPPPAHFDFIVKPSIAGQIVTFYVLIRPGADEFLRELSRKFEVVVFTAGLKEYASLVLNQLDPGGKMVSHRLYRDACTDRDGIFVKDLSGLGRDLGRAVIVDDNPNAYMLHKENAVPVKPFVDDLGDRELYRIIKFFDIAVHYEDTRDAVAYYLSESDDRKINH